jgi:hypothetical protein
MDNGIDHSSKKRMKLERQRSVAGMVALLKLCCGSGFIIPDQKYPDLDPSFNKKGEH